MMLLPASRSFLKLAYPRTVHKLTNSSDYCPSGDLSLSGRMFAVQSITGTSYLANGVFLSSTNDDDDDEIVFVSLSLSLSLSFCFGAGRLSPRAPRGEYVI